MSFLAVPPGVLGRDFPKATKGPRGGPGAGRRADKALGVFRPEPGRLSAGLAHAGTPAGQLSTHRAGSGSPGPCPCPTSGVAGRGQRGGSEAPQDESARRPGGRPRVRAECTGGSKGLPLEEAGGGPGTPPHPSPRGPVTPPLGSDQPASLPAWSQDPGGRAEVEAGKPA